MPPSVQVTQRATAAVTASFRLDGADAESDASTWSGFLRGLTGAGRLRIATSRPSVALEHMGHWRETRIRGSLGIASGRRFMLAMQLDRWSGIRRGERATIAGDGLQRLSVLGSDGCRLLDLGVDSTRAGGLELTPPQRSGAVSARAAPSRGGPDGPDESEDAWSLLAGLGHSIHPIDLAEALGQHRLNPARLRERGRVTAVDVELAPCFLEAIAEQALTVRILSGTSGVAHSLDRTFFHHRRLGPWTTLRGDSAVFRIDVSTIDSAWVLTAGTAGHERASLRLYDAHGRLLAWLAAAPGFCGGESPIWRTLINALLD